MSKFDVESISKFQGFLLDVEKTSNSVDKLTKFRIASVFLDILFSHADFNVNYKTPMEKDAESSQSHTDSAKFVKGLSP